MANMKKHFPRISYQNILIYTVVVLFFLLIVPLISIRLFPHLIENGPESTADITLPDTVSIYITDEEKIKEIPFETYITGVVA